MGSGYSVLLLRLIPGDILNECPHRQFHKLPDLLESRGLELPWRSGSVMDRHATAPGSIVGRDVVFAELHVLRKGQ